MLLGRSIEASSYRRFFLGQRDIFCPVYQTQLDPTSPFSGDASRLQLNTTGKTLIEISNETDLARGLRQWRGNIDGVWPISFQFGIFNDPDYQDRYVSIGTIPVTILLNQAYISAQLEPHMVAVVAWALTIKKFRSLGFLKDTFYHQNSRGRSLLDNFAATCFTTLIASGHSGLTDGLIIPKQVHMFDGLSPGAKFRLIQIFTELKAFMNLQGKDMLEEAETDDEGVLPLISSFATIASGWFIRRIKIGSTKPS